MDRLGPADQSGVDEVEIDAIAQPPARAIVTHSGASDPGFVAGERGHDAKAAGAQVTFGTEEGIGALRGAFCGSQVETFF